MSEQHEKLDEILDKALAAYGQAEPRMGLEARVLARLEEAKTSPARAWWWKWAWAPAAALLLAGGLYLARPHTPLPTAPSVAGKPVAPAVTAAQPEAPAVIAAAPAKPRVRPRVAPKVAEAAARQPQFPAPQPPSEQEKLLLAYVRTQPQAAAQQAQAAAAPLAEMKIKPLEFEPLNPDGDQQPQH